MRNKDNRNKKNRRHHGYHGYPRVGKAKMRMSNEDRLRTGLEFQMRLGILRVAQLRVPCLRVANRLMFTLPEKTINNYTK